MNVKNRWIFGSFPADFCWLHLPGILGVVIAGFFRDKGSTLFSIYAFLVLGVLDGGHLYFTAFRTYLNPAELRRHRGIYIAVPALLFAGLFAFAFLPGAGSWMAGLYLTIRAWHGIRQFYGISKWYQIKNGVMRATSDRFLYFLCSFPFIVSLLNGWVTADRFNTLPVANPGLRIFSVAIYCLSFAAWGAYEHKTWTGEVNRILSIGIPALFFAGTFFTNHIIEANLAISFAHAVGYIGLVQVALEKTKSPIVANRSAWTAIFMITLMTGAVLHWLALHLQLAPNQIISRLGVFGLAIFCSHVWFDTFLWKRTHPEAASIYAY